MKFTAKINEKTNLVLSLEEYNNQAFVEINGRCLDYHNTHEEIQSAISNKEITLEEGKEIEKAFNFAKEKTHLLDAARLIDREKLEDLAWSAGEEEDRVNSKMARGLNKI